MDMTFPPKPEKPLDGDCCGQGCDPCILDLYQDELQVWEEECNRIKNGETSRGKDRQDASTSTDDFVDSGKILIPTEYQTFVIREIETDTKESKRYRFALPLGATLGINTGQHIVIRGEVDGETITRQYTPVSHVQNKSSFQLLIKVYDDGKMSQLVREWVVGTAVQIRGPCGHLYQYLPNKHHTMYMFAVGSGIAPMAQVIQTVLGNEDDETRLQLHYGCSTYTDILLKSWIDDWSRYWNFCCNYYLSKEPERQSGQYRYGDIIHKARIGKEKVKSAINNNIDNCFVLICGTKSFEKDIIEYLSDINVPKESFHKF